MKPLKEFIINMHAFLECNAMFPFLIIHGRYIIYTFDAGLYEVKAGLRIIIRIQFHHHHQR